MSEDASPLEEIARRRLVPVMVVDRPQDANGLAAALVAGGAAAVNFDMPATG